MEIRPALPPRSTKPPRRVHTIRATPKTGGDQVHPTASSKLSFRSDFHGSRPSLQPKVPAQCHFENSTSESTRCETGYRISKRSNLKNDAGRGPAGRSAARWRDRRGRGRDKRGPGRDKNGPEQPVPTNPQTRNRKNRWRPGSPHSKQINLSSFRSPWKFGPPYRLRVPSLPEESTPSAQPQKPAAAKVHPTASSRSLFCHHFHPKRPQPRYPRSSTVPFWNQPAQPQPNSTPNPNPQTPNPQTPNPQTPTPKPQPTNPQPTNPQPTNPR
jgi:hypothetical protein